MNSLIVVLAIVAVLVWRYVRPIIPVLGKVASYGDDIGGWALAWHFAGQPTKRIMSSGARVMLGISAVLVALFVPAFRYAVAVFLAVKLYRWRAGRRGTEAKLSAAGFTMPAERLVVSESVTQALMAMGLGSKGVDPVPPRCYRWRRLPVLVGGRPLKGEYRYECLVEPAPGRSVAQLAEYAGRGLDADEDHIRDAVNSMLRAARGRDAEQLRKAGLLPTFVMSTLEQVTRKGEKIGLARLTLWSTDPFRRPVKYPYDPAAPRVKAFTDPVPVGLLRSNSEATLLLARHTSVQGINGSGKSSVVRPALVAAAHTDATIVCLALKGPGDYEDLTARFAGGVIVTDKRKAANVLRWADKEIQRRNALPTADRNALGHLLIILDEGQELGDDIALIVPIVKKGRSARVWLWSVTQYGLSSIIPSEAAREMGQRLAGRIEGTVNQAQVAVGARANKTRGPHLIPEDPRWVGVLFGNDGAYMRSYWVTCESAPGRASMLARCARAVGARPDDPEGFIEAASTAMDPADRLPDLALAEWPEDGTKRAASGEVLSLDVEELPAHVLAALTAVWPLTGKRTALSGHMTVSVLRKALDAAERRLAARDDSDTDAADQLAVITEFLTRPLAAV